MRMRLWAALMAVLMMAPPLAGAQEAPEPPAAEATAETFPVEAVPVEAAPIEAAVAADGYGLSREQAIEVCYPEGEQQYLARLVCPDNSHPTFERSGSVGSRQPMPEDMSDAMMASLFADMRKPRKREPGEPDYHIIDAYEVVCGEARTTLYLDMYHCAQDRPTFSPKGFSIID